MRKILNALKSLRAMISFAEFGLGVSVLSYPFENYFSETYRSVLHFGKTVIGLYMAFRGSYDLTKTLDDYLKLDETNQEKSVD